MENVWILLAIFVVLMMMHVPIAVAMGLSSLIGFMMIGYNLTTVGSLLYTAVASTSMITIPGYIFAGAIMERRDFETSAECSECLDWTCSGGRGHCDRSCLCHVCSDHRLCFRNHRSGRRADDPCNDRLQLSEVVFYGAGSQCGIFGNPDPPKHPNDSLYDDSRSIGIKIVRCWHACRADRGRCVLNLYCYL